MRTRTERLIALSIFFVVMLVGVAVQGEASQPSPSDVSSSQDPQFVSVPATELPAVPQKDPALCEVGDCSVAIPATCNSVFTWYNQYGNQWQTYDCLDTDVFPSLPYSEALYSLAVPTSSLDIGLRILAAITDQAVFGAVLDECDNDDCQAAAYFDYGGDFWRDAVVADAATGVYTVAIDSANMRGGGGAQIACGSHETGWCEDAVSATLPCSTYSIHDNTQNGKNRIIYYGPDEDDGEDWIYDGRELVYKFVLTQTSLLSGTLHYAGNPDKLLDQKMATIILSETCDQRSWLAFSNWVGERAPKSDTGNAIGLPGTYYVVVEGIAMGDEGGDAFSMDILCVPLYPAFLPTLLRAP